MFSRLHHKNKKIIVNGMVALAVMLFVIAFFIGRKVEEKSTNAALNKEQQNHLYSQPGKTLDQGHEMDLHEEYEFEESIIDKSKEVNEENRLKMADFHSAADIQASKKAAESFIRVYYPFDGNHPLQHIEKSKPYMTNELFQQHWLNPARPTYHTFKKKLTRIEIREPFDSSRYYIAWDVIVNGEVENAAGNPANETAWFLLKMVKKGNEFKVSSLALNKPH